MTGGTDGYHLHCLELKMLSEFILKPAEITDVTDISRFMTTLFGYDPDDFVPRNKILPLEVF